MFRQDYYLPLPTFQQTLYGCVCRLPPAAFAACCLDTPEQRKWRHKNSDALFLTHDVTYLSIDGSIVWSCCNVFCFTFGVLCLLNMQSCSALSPPFLVRLASVKQVLLPFAIVFFVGALHNNQTFIHSTSSDATKSCIQALLSALRRLTIGTENFHSLRMRVTETEAL